MFAGAPFAQDISKKVGHSTQLGISFPSTGAHTSYTRGLVPIASTFCTPDVPSVSARVTFGAADPVANTTPLHETAEEREEEEEEAEASASSAARTQRQVRLTHPETCVLWNN